MKIDKPSAALIAIYEAVAPPAPAAERRQMFGMPCCFAHGNMFMGLFGESMMLRLPEPERTALTAMPGGGPFEPAPGRVMREYVRVPPALLADPAELRPWVARALAYAQSLPAKAKKSKQKTAARGAKQAARLSKKPKK